MTARDAVRRAAESTRDPGKLPVSACLRHTLGTHAIEGTFEGEEV